MLKRAGVFFENTAFTAVQLVCPPKCVLCEKVLFVGEQICTKCRKKLPFVGQYYCMKCGKPIENEKEYCAGCQRKKYYFERNVSLWTYSPQLKKSLYRFKYSNKRYYAKYYASEIYKKYGRLIFSWNIDVVVPVPLYYKKRRKRGYNQAEVLARELCKLTKLPIDTKMVVRTKNTVPQKQLNEKERQKNVKDVFQIGKSVVKLKKILLIDDIFTTGSTVNEIAKILKEAGCDSVYVVTLCVGRGY